MKKYISEMIGTMVLVLMGCGSAIFNGGCETTAQVLRLLLPLVCRWWRWLMRLAGCPDAISIRRLRWAVGCLAG